MVVGAFDHPWFDERILLEHFAFDPRTGARHRLRNLPRLPILVMNQPAKQALQLAETECLWLTEQQRRFGWHILAALDNSQQCVGQIIEMEERLPSREIAGINMADEPALINARDLMGEKGRMAEVVIDPGGTHEHGGNASPLVMNQPLGAILDSRYGSFGSRGDSSLIR